MENTVLILKRNEVIFHEGDKSDCMYDIRLGRVGIYANYGTKEEKLLTELTKDQFFGEMGIIEGYPDGTFGGDRTMTRYEFATMLFKAMQNGAVLSEQIRQEFNAELGRIRVDRIKGADDDANKIERVRVNNYEDRDDYGSKIVQVKAGA